MANRLKAEKSPYLQQHASDPVDWFPWCNEAFDKAAQEGKPVFVSIGYSTCHWCHVMAEESFRDWEVADYLNRHFISIKVDREERPDVDMLYMSVCHALTGSGGWPLSVFTTPDRRPFFAGSYFPKRPMGGLPAFISILKEIKNRWDRQRERLEAASKEVVVFQEEEQSASGDWKPLDVERISDQSMRVMDLLFDQENGGFGDAPKFPSALQLFFLEDRFKQRGEERCRDFITQTLDAMYRGGIFDQIGFGFHRYCVDNEWRIPHFEKTLYDQAMLIMAYSRGYALVGKEEYREAALRTIAYAAERLLDHGGGFYAGEDADSEGEEGKFYVWSKEELYSIFQPAEVELVSKYFGIEETGNYQGSYSVPRRTMGMKEFADLAGTDLKGAAEMVERFRLRLFEEREKRGRPGLDNKVITAWNGLMVAALVTAHRLLGGDQTKDADSAKVMSDYASYRGGEGLLQIAERAGEFILSTMLDGDQLMRRWVDGEVKFPGFLDDYAATVWGLLDLYDATGSDRYISVALRLARRMVDDFSDPEGRGFFYPPSGANDLPVRQMESFDGPVPSGASMAAYVLLRLNDLTGEKEYYTLAIPILKRAARLSHGGPLSQLFALCVMDMVALKDRTIH